MVTLKDWTVSLDEKDWHPDKPCKITIEGHIYNHLDFEDGAYVTIISESNHQNINDQTENMICVIHPDRNKPDLDWFYKILKIIQE